MKRLLLLVFFAVPLHAHDFWIEPSRFRAASGEPVSVSLRVGEHFRGDPVPRRPARIESFVVRDASGVHAVAGADNVHPAGTITVASSDAAVIGYRSRFSEVELPRGKFEAYLREEGLENRIRVATDGTQRERYARFAKSIVNGHAAPEPFGWRIELLTSDASRFRVLHEGKPLAGTLVIALSRAGKRHQARTDRDGFVDFDLATGEWLIKTVHMVPAAPDSGAQWESLWASLTLQK